MQIVLQLLTTKGWEKGVEEGKGEGEGRRKGKGGLEENK